MTASNSIFQSLKVGGADPIMAIVGKYRQDPSPEKIDLSVGVYKDEAGECYLFPSIAKAKEVVAKKNESHNYTSMAGIADFNDGARKLIFGNDRCSEGRITSLQTISGTGALHMVSVFTTQVAEFGDIYIGTPAWGNYIPMFEHTNNKIQTYQYYDAESKQVDFPSVVKTLENAPSKSVFLFQACCHNPTGADFTRDQWIQVSKIMQERNLFPIFDIAYLGLGSGSIEEDAWAIRYFYDLGFEMIVCQSFSKNMGLYSERVGCLHVVVSDAERLPALESKLISNFRVECSFAPAYGARVAIEAMSEDIQEQWKEEVKECAERLQKLRNAILSKLTELKTPGHWDNVVSQSGLFWFSGLTVDQINKLREQEHVYLTLDGRINVAGLTLQNVDKFCESVDRVVRQ